MTKEENRLYNVMGAYCSGEMLSNFIKCVKEDLGANKSDRRLYNRMVSLEKELKSFMGPTKRHLKEFGTEEALEDAVIKVHEAIDEFLKMN